jgi:uncharacterized protein YndB with AHSA1/START domain
MQERTVTHSTFVIERSYNFSPGHVFSAFSDSTKKRRWYAAGRSVQLEEFEMDFRPGGHDRVLYRFPEGSPFPGAPLLYETTYLDVVPDRRITFAYAMSIGSQCVSASLGTFEFLPSEKGTELIFTEQGAYFENSGGQQMREEGWRNLLDRLAEYLAG